MDREQVDRAGHGGRGLRYRGLALGEQATRIAQEGVRRAIGGTRQGARHEAARQHDQLEDRGRGLPRGRGVVAQQAAQVRRVAEEIMEQDGGRVGVVARRLDVRGEPAQPPALLDGQAGCHAGLAQRGREGRAPLPRGSHELHHAPAVQAVLGPHGQS